jgi:phosphoserine phosphatase
MNKGVVVDLDGTLLSTNTFIEYILFSFRKTIGSACFSTALKLVFFVVCRKLRIIKHERMKFHILNLTNSYIGHPLIDEFVSSLLPKLDIRVLDVLKEYKQNDYKICLSTAAPEIYVNQICERLHQTFDFVCSTPMPSETLVWKENARQVKCDNTLSLLNKENTKLNVLITDHSDDIPLLSIEKDLNILFNPSKQTIFKLKLQNITYLIL